MKRGAVEKYPSAALSPRFLVRLRTQCPKECRNLRVSADVQLATPPRALVDALHLGIFQQSPREWFRSLLLGVLGLLVMTAVAAADHHMQGVAQEAKRRCGEGTHRVKDDFFIPQANLSEKENCFIAQFSQILVERYEDIITKKAQDSIRFCVQEAAISEDRIDLKIFSGCLDSDFEHMAAIIAEPCRELKAVVKTGLGRQACEEIVSKLLFMRYQEMIRPKPHLVKALYRLLNHLLAPFQWLAWMLAVGLLSFYLFGIFWQGSPRPWQIGTVVAVLVVLGILRLWWGFVLAPYVMVIVLATVLAHKHWPRKKQPEPDKGLSWEDVKNYYDRHQGSH